MADPPDRRRRLSLARAGRSVLLIEEALDGADRVGEAIPPAARPILEALGLRHHLMADGHLPSYGNLSIWGSDEPYSTDFILDPNGHGWHLDRSRFDSMLRDAARHAGAEVLSGVRLADAVWDRNGDWLLRLEGDYLADSVVRSRWLVDATGRRSAIAVRLGAARLRDDRLVAFHARFRPAPGGSDRDSRTTIEAVQGGWWYTGLLPTGERLVALLTDGDLADRPALLTPAGFRDRLAEARHIHLQLVGHGYELEGRPRGADAGSARLTHFAGNRWLAVGDAAISFDPLSSQGLMTALYTGLRCGEAIDRALSDDPELLAVYAERLVQIYASYLRNLATCYASERRWSSHPFWSRRNHVV